MTVEFTCPNCNETYFIDYTKPISPSGLDNPPEKSDPGAEATVTPDNCPYCDERIEFEDVEYCL